MSTATETPSKSTIDPDLENGAVALAERVLPEDEQRTECALALQAASRRLETTRERRSLAVERQEQIAAELPDASEAQRTKLSEERAALTAELIHAPSDAEAAAQAFADALIAWATTTVAAARKLAVSIEQDLSPLRSERARKRSKISPSRPKMNKPSGVEAEAIEKTCKALTEEMRPLREQLDLAQQVRSKAAYALTSRFGDSDADKLFPTPGVRRWVGGVHERVSRQTVKWTGATNALKPRGW